MDNIGLILRAGAREVRDLVIFVVFCARKNW